MLASELWVYREPSAIWVCIAVGGKTTVGCWKSPTDQDRIVFELDARLWRMRANLQQSTDNAAAGRQTSGLFQVQRE